MSKLLLAMFLYFISINAHAKWTLVLVSEDAMIKTYFDFDAIKQKGDVVTVWELTSYEKPQKLVGFSYKSAVSITHYDCKERNYRSSYTAVYEDQMLSGKLIQDYTYTENESLWKPIIPSTNGQSLIIFACTKK